MSANIAAVAYRNISMITILVNHKFDEPGPIELLHGTQYFLASRDGEGNEIYWDYYGMGHPVKDVIDAELDRLSQCAHRAEQMFEAGI